MKLEPMHEPELHTADGVLPTTRAVLFHFASLSISATELIFFIDFHVQDTGGGARRSTASHRPGSPVLERKREYQKPRAPNLVLTM